MSSWRTVVYAVVVTGLGGMPVWLLSAFAPQIGADLGFDSVGLGLIIGSFFALSAVTGLPAGRVVVTLDWRNGIVLSALLAAVSMAVVAVVARHWLVLVVALAVGAAANSSSQPAANLAVASAVRQGRQGLALGIKQAALPIATMLVGLSVPLFERDSDWRIAFGAVALVALVLALVAGAPALTGVRRWRADRHASRVRFRRAGRRRVAGRRVHPSLILLATGAGFGTAATMSLGGFLVVYAVDRGLTLAEAGQLLAFGSAIGIVSRVLSGYLADRRGRRHLIVVAFMMLVGSVGLGLIAVADGLPLLLIGTALAYGQGWAWNGVFHLAVVRYGTGSPAISTGIVQTAMSIGAMIGPVAFGLTSAWSYPVAWQGCAVALGLGAVFVLVGRRKLPR